VRVKKEYDGDAVVLSLPRHLVGGDEIDEIQREILLELANGRKKFVLNLARTQSMSTRAVSMFIDLRKKLDAGGAAWAFCNVDKKIYEPLVVMRFVRDFNVCNTREGALSLLNLDGRMTKG